jgi:DNA polymerase-3 subunit delta
VIVVLFGANELAMRRRIQELKDEADGGSGMLVTNLTAVDGRDAKPADVLGPVMSPPFLAPRRLVIVEHLLERYESRMAARGGRALGPWEDTIAELGKGIPDTTTLVFFGQPFLAEGRPRTVSKSNPFVAALSKLPGVSVEEHPALEKDNLLRYIAEEANLRGIRFKRGGGEFESHEERPAETDPVILLANLLQGDTLSIANELDKLALYSRDRRGEITVADVNRVSHGDREAKSWDLTDAIIEGNLARALYALRTLKESGEALQGLLGLITARYRSLAPVTELVSAGMRQEAIAEELKRPNNYPLKKDFEASRRLTPALVKRAYGYIVEADRTNKMGEVDEEVGIDILLMKLCALGRRA